MTTSITRQHFNAIAETIARTPGLTRDQRATLADRMVTALHPFNNRINRDRFVRAAVDTPDWVDAPTLRKAADDAKAAAWLTDRLAHTPAVPPALADEPPFTAVASGMYDAGTDTLTTHPVRPPFDARDLKTRTVEDRA